jgi:hypothetical protein
VLSRLEMAKRSAYLGIDLNKCARLMSKSREYRNAMMDFGTMDDTVYFSVPIPNISRSYVDEMANIVNGEMRFHTASVFELLFNRQQDAILQPHERLLGQFCSKYHGQPITRLILHGELGNVAYVQRWIKGRIGVEIQMMVAPDPWLGVCKGLVADIGRRAICAETRR